MKAVILHAYSSTNSGDGLLVDEAIGLIRSVEGAAQIMVLALDPDSFNVEGKVEFLHPLTGRSDTPSGSRTALAALLAIIRGMRLPTDVQARIDDADLLVGVGGGYLRAAHLTEAAKMVLAHLPQLATSNRRGGRAVYLPQSVGALRWGTAQLVRRFGNSVTWHLRDDRSVGLLGDVAVVRRTPDSAVLPFGNGGYPLVPRSGLHGIGLVARKLHSTGRRNRAYEDSMRRLVAELRPELLLQASARGNDDSVFYSDVLRASATRSLMAGTQAEDAPAVVVSVRLHGAIQSLRNGVPAVHLSYERKGWGAYEDLGISEFVHNAFNFNPEQVARQTRELANDSTRFWAAIKKSGCSIAASRDALIKELALSGHAGDQGA